MPQKPEPKPILKAEKIRELRDRFKDDKGKSVGIQREQRDPGSEGRG